MEKILIAIDDGPMSEQVATRGYELGKQLNAEIAILSVVDTEFLITTGGITPKEMAEITRVELIKKQEILLERIFKDQKVMNFVENGNPYEVILKTAADWQADLIVLGTHGRTGLKHLLLGSVAEKVLRHSTIPLYIIPSK